MTENHIPKSMKDVHQKNDGVKNIVIQTLEKKLEENNGKSIKPADIKTLSGELIELQTSKEDE